MKKFLDLSSWSRKAAIGSMLIMAFAVVGCDDDDSWSPSARPNDEPGMESSSSVEFGSSSSEKVKPQSSSSEKSGMSSSSVNNASSSSEKLGSSSSVGTPESSSSEKLSEASSSSAGKVDCSTFLELEKKHDKWNWYVPKECRFNPDIDYGSMTDSRDGQVYRTVKIGSQVWMAENLNYAYTGVKFNYRDDNSDKDYSSDSSSWCYLNALGNCAGTGRLYTWAAAIDSVKLANDAENPLDCGYGKNCSLPARVQGICPEGWHLPTAAEWDTLFTTVGGKSTAGNILKSQTGWCCDANGDDAYGFSALPVGFRHQSGYFEHFRDHAYFWSGDATLLVEKAGSMSLIAKDEYAHRSGSYKFFAYSVRCLQD